MAQVLKEEIRENILQAALQEFFDNGYKSATMSNIAAKAKVPTGLIYSYYKNKEALFHAVLQPVLYNWKRVLSVQDTAHNGNEIYGLSKAETDCLLTLFHHRKEFIILMDKSSGTKYASEKESFVKEIERHLTKHCKEKNPDSVFIHIIANNYHTMMSLLINFFTKDNNNLSAPSVKKAYAELSSTVGMR